MTAIAIDQQDSFEVTALPHLDSLYRFALRLAGEADIAEDLVQDTMLKAYRAWDRFQTGGNVRGWLMTILRNTFLNQRRRERRAGVVADVMELESFTVFQNVQEVDPEGDFFEQLVDDEVWHAIDQLPQEYRETLVLRDVEGMAYDQIAGVLGIKIGTVKSRLFRARQALQSRLYEYAVQAGYLDPKTDESDDDPQDPEVAEAIMEVTGEFCVGCV
jgi:RNA polymerase sigma-70 factor (ECF subfamily)